MYDFFFLMFNFFLVEGTFGLNLTTFKRGNMSVFTKRGFCFFSLSLLEQTCLDIATAFGSAEIYQLVKDKFESMPKPKNKGKGKGKVRK